MNGSFYRLSPSETLEATKNPDGSLTVEITTGQGHGTMRNYLISPDFFIALVDFSLPACPPFPKDILKDYPSKASELSNWITINYCVSGRCEVHLPSTRAIIVKSGDCCVSLGEHKLTPKEYLYPLNHYTGLELYLCLDFLEEDSFSILRESGFSMETWRERLLSFPVIFTQDKVLSGLLASLYSCLRPFDGFSCKLKLMDILNHIKKAGLRADEKIIYYSRSQIQMAREVHDLLTANPELPYDQKQLAQAYNVSVNTLNNYFRALYGKYIPAFLRDHRMGLAAAALRTTEEPVYSIAAASGYSNASKFSAAFKRCYGEAPSEYRRGYRLPDAP